MHKRPRKLSKKTSLRILGRETFAAISAVEGLKLTRAGHRRIASPHTSDHRRAEVMKAYLDIKVGK
jgi:predicted RNA-binding protein with PUA domain